MSTRFTHLERVNSRRGTSRRGGSSWTSVARVGTCDGPRERPKSTRAPTRPTAGDRRRTPTVRVTRAMCLYIARAAQRRGVSSRFRCVARDEKLGRCDGVRGSGKRGTGQRMVSTRGGAAVAASSGAGSQNSNGGTEAETGGMAAGGCAAALASRGAHHRTGTQETTLIVVYLRPSTRSDRRAGTTGEARSILRNNRCSRAR